MDEQGWSKLYSGSAVSESPPGASRFYVIKGTGCEAETRLGREVFRKGRFEDGRRLLHVAVCSVCRNILVKDHGTFFSVLPHRERSRVRRLPLLGDIIMGQDTIFSLKRDRGKMVVLRMLPAGRTDEKASDWATISWLAALSLIEMMHFGGD